MKLDYRKTFLIGLGFFGVTLVWTLYNAFAPILLRNFISSATIIGLIMTLDNLLAVTIQPIVGAVSDKTRTGIGRRMPYILIGAPLAAIFFALIPFANTLWLLIFTIILMNLFMAIFRSPVIALMPDIIPSPLRSKANGVINFMGGAGAIVVFFVASPLFDINRNIPFIGIAIIMVLAIALLYITIKEPKKIPHEEAEDISWHLVKVSTIAIVVGLVTFLLLNKTGVLNPFFEEMLRPVGKIIPNDLIAAAYQGQILVAIVCFALIIFITILKKVERNAIFIFLSIFFWFFGYNAVETFFTLYGVEFLWVSPGFAGIMLGVFSATFVIFAIPSGLLGTKIGRKKTIMGGLAVLAIVLGAMSSVASIMMIFALMFLGGIAWAAVNINSYPMVCDITTEEMLGTYTGLYYFFSMLAQSISPPVIGIIVDKTGSYHNMFYVVPIFFILAFITMSFVKRGEAKEITTSEIMEQMEV